ncbi:F-box protein CPR1-like [Corylus avellana]|uniref:F-box protein CPR1-like n=1 Tax=Corylus avellana TaxID=13451 RepID=UPI001E1FC241|nr:F-box protein CPR1-like [Corylus avellana]
MSTYLPEELMLKILCRVPPKSLIRFRCVSKSWLEMIGNPDFFSHNPLNYSILISQETPNHLLLLVKGTEKFITKREVLSFLSYKTLDSVDQIPHTLKLVASCKGLLCLHKFRTSDVYLWNPATPSVGLKALPPVTFRVRDVFGSCLGFGFDSRSNDFKVVRILIIEFQTKGIENFFHMNKYVEVYSLSGGSWRLLDLEVPMFFGFLICSGTLALDGAFIWWMPGHDIVVFDFSDEVFRTMPLPRLSSYWESINISLLNGHVTLLAFAGSGMHAKCSLEIWVLLEFGVKESWTRLTTIGLPMGLEMPLGFWRRGELFMESSEGQLVLYDPFTRTKKNLQIDAIKRSFQIVLHTKSSVAV